MDKHAFPAIIVVLSSGSKSAQRKTRSNETRMVYVNDNGSKKRSLKETPCTTKARDENGTPGHRLLIAVTQATPVLNFYSI